MTKKIKKKEGYVEISILKVNQNIGEFYIGIANAQEILKICSAEERRVSWDDLERYIGMQRPLSPGRVKEIRTYLKTQDATFPNSIILALGEKSFFIEGGKLYIKNQKDSANILDGQHRLAGFTEESHNFDLIVTLFPGLSIEDQAYLFSVINTKQNKINPSLAQELYALAKLETPQKIAHNLAVEFNNNEKSPWYHKIKRLGKRGPFGEEILSQSTFTREIIELICDSKDNYSIRDILKRTNNDRSSLRGKFNYKIETKIFWEPYLDKRDDFIFNTLKSFFHAVRDNFSKEWGDKDFILTKTTGYSAIIRIFKELYKMGFKNKDLTFEFFNKYILKAKNSGKIKKLTSENYNPGKQGESELYQDFLSAMEIR
ncbi:MAG: DGQHR domain-containing protein [Candidatus Pacearchaeota archaeon]